MFNLKKFINQKYQCSVLPGKITALNNLIPAHLEVAIFTILVAAISSTETDTGNTETETQRRNIFPFHVFSLIK